MALGKQIGEFSLQPTSITYEPVTGSGMKVHVNMAGTVSGDGGEGTITLTHYVEAEPGAKSGTYRHYGFINLSDGTGVGIRGDGTWEETGPSAWRYRGTGQNSDGSTVALEWEGSLATGTWAGKVYEWN